jgi:hypothetical protein
MMPSFILFVMRLSVLLTLAAGGACLSARAQGGGRPTQPLPVQQSGQNVMRVRGAGRHGPVANGGFTVPERPRPLTAAEKLSIAGGQVSKIVNVPVELSFKNPYDPDTGYLRCFNTYFLETGPGAVAAFKNQPDFVADLDFGTAKILLLDFTKGRTGKHYLIDFRVYGGETYYVRAGEMKQTFSGNPYHIAILYEATSNDYLEIAVNAKTKSYWAFLSVEITQLN